MIPHAYATDAQHKSEELASMILAASSPPKIVDACAAVESFLRHHSADQSRWFFSVTLPTLICKIFGFNDSLSSKPSSSTGWIDIVCASNDADLAGRVFNLLSPNGVLMSSISSVDRLSLVKYVFPIERLPEWVRFMLSSERDRRLLPELCPLFKGRFEEDPVKGSVSQVQLNVFEYYMFWFAYYPVCRGNSDNSDAIPAQRGRKFKLENWASSFPVFVGTRRGPEQKVECSLYVRLLYAYLRSNVLIRDSNAHQPYRSSLLHYPSGYDGSIELQAEFFVNTLIHFWLVYNDFSSLPMNVCKSFGVSFPLRTVLGETPPVPGLGDVVKLFVKYLNMSSVSVTEVSDTVDSSGSPRWRISSSIDVLKSRDAVLASPSMSSWNSLIQRPLYRFILRTFLFYPAAISMKNASQVFSLWISYMEPWAVGMEDFAEFDRVVDRSANIFRKEDAKSPSCGYSSTWQGYILSNYLFYSSLVMHFIGFAHKFLHTDPEVIVQMVLKVISILMSSTELIDLMKKTDTLFHSKQTGSAKVMLNSLCRFVPQIREQLQDWEDGLCESDADGSFLHDNWNKDLRLFSDGEDGGQQLLQLFILRAESELQAMSGDNLAHNLQCIDTLKAQLGGLFGGDITKPMLITPETRQCQRSREEIFKPRRVGNCAMADIKYKGDWMNRPISDDEVAWLAKLLVWLSCWLNENLGLNQLESRDAGLRMSYVEVSSDIIGKVCGPTETAKMVLCSIGSWLLMVGLGMVRLMRRYGLRVNLRVLASKKVVMVLLMLAAVSILKNAFGLLRV
ncbi:uncharacterized protein LOC131164803 [Malania oleifera]|uniref:uncharacterized protein LOC131164803 n=1 Tax=Malania oleifera TaxID=397392 RepID=UPI0025AE490C|nr:uncharacterized protein LOC131164803 [Malania oleifera]